MFVMCVCVCVCECVCMCIFVDVIECCLPLLYNPF